MISPDQCLAPGACLVVTVLDHDKLKRDDFEGEAFLALKDIPGVKEIKEENEVPAQPDVKPEQIRLRLMHPKTNGSIIHYGTPGKCYKAKAYYQNDSLFF